MRTILLASFLSMAFCLSGISQISFWSPPDCSNNSSYALGATSEFNSINQESQNEKVIVQELNLFEEFDFKTGPFELILQKKFIGDSLLFYSLEEKSKLIELQKRYKLRERIEEIPWNCPTHSSSLFVLLGDSVLVKYFIYEDCEVIETPCGLFKFDTTLLYNSGKQFLLQEEEKIFQFFKEFHIYLKKVQNDSNVISIHADSSFRKIVHLEFVDNTNLIEQIKHDFFWLQPVIIDAKRGIETEKDFQNMVEREGWDRLIYDAVYRTSSTWWDWKLQTFERIQSEEPRYLISLSTNQLNAVIPSKGVSKVISEKGTTSYSVKILRKKSL